MCNDGIHNINKIAEKRTEQNLKVLNLVNESINKIKKWHLSCYLRYIYINITQKIKKINDNDNYKYINTINP